MTKKIVRKKKPPKKISRKEASLSDPQANRRREWRLELPLPAKIEGKLPDGKKFQEDTTIENISARGVYFCLDSGVIIGSKLNLAIDLPGRLAGQEKLKLCLGGLTVRLEEKDKKDKKQGVALRFHKKFKIIPSEKEKK
jgi:c-di-GMP-binding flagellar brake protein YcgR